MASACGQDMSKSSRTFNFGASASSAVHQTYHATPFHRSLQTLSPIEHYPSSQILNAPLSPVLTSTPPQRLQLTPPLFKPEFTLLVPVSPTGLPHPSVFLLGSASRVRSSFRAPRGRKGSVSHELAWSTDGVRNWKRGWR